MANYAHLLGLAFVAASMAGALLLVTDLLFSPAVATATTALAAGACAWGWGVVPLRGGARCAPAASGRRRRATAPRGRAAPAASWSTDQARPTPVGPTRVAGVEEHPLAGGLAVQVDGQVGVDEQEALEVQDAADAVAEVRRGGDAGERRRSARRRRAAWPAGTRSGPGPAEARAARRSGAPCRCGGTPRARRPPYGKSEGSAASGPAGAGGVACRRAAGSATSARRRRTARTRTSGAPSSVGSLGLDELEAPAGPRHLGADAQGRRAGPARGTRTSGARPASAPGCAGRPRRPAAPPARRRAARRGPTGRGRAAVARAGRPLV